jgi:hypothetical protein
MRFLLRGRVRWAALGVIVAGLAAGGIAYAAIPDSGGVIHTCYDKFGGKLYVIDTALGQHCNLVSQGQLDFNQTGPQGASGPSGPQGANGATGPSGPSGASDVWAVNGFAMGKDLVGPSYTDIASLSVPAGSFFVAAETVLTSNHGQFICILSDGSSPIAVARAFTDTQFRDATVSLNVVVTFASAGTITLMCRDANDSDSTAHDWQLDAIKVGTVH